MAVKMAKEIIPGDCIFGHRVTRVVVDDDNGVVRVFTGPRFAMRYRHSEMVKVEPASDSVKQADE